MPKGRFRRAAESLTAPVGSVRRLTRVGNQIVLTYDDGPDPQLTPRLLELLAARGYSATFFTLLQRARRHPEVLRDAVRQGHEIALHGWDHRPLTEFGGTDLTASLRAAREELSDLIGLPVRWFRPPYGAQSWASWRATRSAGLEPVMWSASSYDTTNISPRVRAERVSQSLDPGTIILSHDGTADADDGAPTVGATIDRIAVAEWLLTEVGHRGLRGVSVGDAVAGGGRLSRAAWFGG